MRLPRVQQRGLAPVAPRARAASVPCSEGVVVFCVAKGVAVLSGTPAVSIPGLPRNETMVLCALGWGGFVHHHLDEVRLVRQRLVKNGLPVGGFTTLGALRRVATISIPESDNGNAITVALNLVHEAAHHLAPWHRDPLTSEVVAQEAAVLAWRDAATFRLASADERAWSFGWQVAAVRARGGFLYAPFIRAQQRALAGRAVPSAPTGGSSPPPARAPW